MRDNITKVAERGERLDQLQDKTGTFWFPFGYGGASATIVGFPASMRTRLIYALR